MSFSASEIKKWEIFQYDGNVYKCIDFHHAKSGEEEEFIRIKFRNIVTGDTHEEDFRPSEKFEDVIIERKEAQYLFNDGELFYFMDKEIYETITINADFIEEEMKFIKEDEDITVCFYAESAFSVEPPPTVFLEVTETEEVIIRDKDTGVVLSNYCLTAAKPATVQTDAIVYVPLFINIGDHISIDTRTGEYLSRV